MEDVKNIAEIIKRQIYNENIAFYESLAYKNENCQDKVLDLNSILEKDIIDNILNSKNMNVIGGIDISSFVFSDFNLFYQEVLKQRGSSETLKKEIFMLVMYLNDENKNVLFTKLINYFNFHTYLENLEMKRLILVQLNNYPTYDYSNEEVEEIFDNFFKSLSMSDELLNLKKI